MAATTEAEGFLPPVMDGLVEAAAGDTAYFSVQAKDTYGNNRITGGDDLKAVLAFDANMENRDIKYAARVLDHDNGTYGVTYTVPRAGTLTVSAPSYVDRTVRT